MLVGELLCYKYPCGLLVGEFLYWKLIFFFACWVWKWNHGLGILDVSLGGEFLSFLISSSIFFLLFIVFHEFIFLLVAGYVRLHLINLILASLKLSSYERIEYHYLHSFTIVEFLFWRGKLLFCRGMLVLEFWFGLVAIPNFEGTF